MSVLNLAKDVMKNAQFVSITNNINSILSALGKFPSRKSSRWDFPPYDIRSDNVEDVLRFFIIGNSINFQFWYPDGEKFIVEDTFRRKVYSGSNAMWYMLKQCLERRATISTFLKDLNEFDVAKMFVGNRIIPKAKERTRILNEVGKGLSEIVSLKELFSAPVSEIIKNLVIYFPSYNDMFLKRAQLLISMVYGRFRGFSNLPSRKLDIKHFVHDPGKLTVFADYQLPKVLYYYKILQYCDSLEKKILNKELIPSGSQEEIEIRAATIVASNMIARKLGVMPIALDFSLWNLGRKLEDIPHHLTDTTDY